MLYLVFHACELSMCYVGCAHGFGSHSHAGSVFIAVSRAFAALVFGVVVGVAVHGCCWLMFVVFDAVLVVFLILAFWKESVMLIAILCFVCF